MTIGPLFIPIPRQHCWLISSIVIYPSLFLSILTLPNHDIFTVPHIHSHHFQSSQTITMQALLRLRPNSTSPVGGVESLPNTPPPPFSETLPSPSISVHQPISDLPPTVDFDTLLSKEADEGLQQLHQALATTLESRTIAIDTAASLQNQTKQLESIKDDLDDVHDTLDVVDENVHKLTTGIISFPKRAHGSSRREKTSQKPWKGKLDVAKGKIWGKGNMEKKKNEQIQPVVTKQASYSEFQNEHVRKTLKKQDEYLDETSKVLAELKDLATGMGEQVEKEAEVLEQIDAPYVSSRLKYNTNRIRRSILSK